MDCEELKICFKYLMGTPEKKTKTKNKTQKIQNQGSKQSYLAKDDSPLLLLERKMADFELKCLVTFKKLKACTRFHTEYMKYKLY